MIEVEVKVLLGQKENANKLRQQLPEPFTSSSQKNHYFLLNSKELFEKIMTPKIQNKEIFEKIMKSSDISVRTRDTTKKVLISIKASIDDMSSSNGRARLELDQEFPLTLEELDNLLLTSGCSYQAKWSREREEFKRNDVSITIDKNAGYGYLAEFEIMVPDSLDTDLAKGKIYSLLKELNLEELDSKRLERMFDYYNKHWTEYYGTDKVFSIP